MTIHRIAHALAAGIAFVGASLGLHRDAAPLAPETKATVLYLGHGSIERDATYDKFLKLAARTRPALLAAVHIDFVGLPDQDPVAAARILVQALAARPVAIVAPYADSMRIAHQVAGSVPIVFSSYVDPVRGGFVDDLQRRNAPITGIDISDRLDGKRFEILHEAYPGVRNVAVLGDREWLAQDDAAKRIPAEAERFGLHAVILVVETDAELARLFERTDAARFDAWYVPPTYLGYRTSGTIIRKMRQWRKPCIFATTEEVRAGGLIGYAQDTGFAWQALVDLTARVVAGEPPGSIPIMRPRRFVLALRTDADTGVAPPAVAVIRRADLVLH